MQGIFDPRFAFHVRPTLETSHLATVRISRNSGDGGFTDEGWSDGQNDTIYEGKARWQKVGQTTKRDFTEDFAQFNRVRVQIMMENVKKFDPDFTGFKPNDKVELVVNESNPTSEGEVVYYWGDPTSSNAWLFTLNCQQNMKQEG